MITLKEELIKANKITKELDKTLVSLINKYEDDKINDEKFHEEFLKNKDKIKEVEFFTEDGLELYYTLEIFYDYFHDINVENVENVKNYKTVREWIVKELIDFYDKYCPVLDERVCDYRWPAHKDRMRVVHTIDFYTALLKNDFDLLKEVNGHYWDNINDIIEDIDFSTFNKNNKFDQEVIKLLVDAIDYHLRDREDPFDPYGGSYERSYAIFKLVEKIGDLEMDTDYIIEVINDICYETFDEMLEKIGEKEFLKEKRREDIKNNINEEEKIKEIISQYPEISFKFISGSTGLDDQTPAELYLKKGDKEIVLKGHGPFGFPGIDKRELEEALEKLNS